MAVTRALDGEYGHAAHVVCGRSMQRAAELAADPEMLGFFLRIGIDELSVSPTSILPLRKAVTDF